MVYLIIILVYFLAVVAVGVFSRRMSSTVENFFIAGRRGSTLLITGSLLATILGGSATIGMAGLGFSRGLTGLWWLFVGSIGLLVLGLFLAAKVRKYALFTLPQLVQKQYGTSVSIVTSALIVIAWTGVIAGQIVASGKILGVLGMGSPAIWMVVFTVVFVGYTLIGGQYADIRTDLIQAVLIFTGIFGSLAIVLMKLGGWSGLVTALPPAHLEFPLSAKFGILDFISYLLLIGLTYVVGPDMYSRLFCSRDSGTARRAALWTSLLLVPFALGITFMGMGAAALFPGILPEEAFPVLVRHQLPPLMGGLVLAGLVSATMSSADSCVMSSSTILTFDIINRFKPSLSQRQLLIIAKCGIVLLGVLALLLALALQGVINALLFAYTVYTGGVIVPVLFGFFKNRLRLTWTGAMASVIGGGMAALVSKLAAIKYLDLGSLGIGIALLLIVSFIHRQILRK